MPWKACSVMDERLRFIARLLEGESMSEGRVPPGGVGAVGKWPAGATAESLAQAGHLPTVAATEVVTVAAPGRVGLHTQL